jgi:predicted acyl esterase
MEEVISIGEIEDDEIIPRIPDFANTMNYCISHLFQEVGKTERIVKINEWLSSNANRRQVLEKAVEVCLRARDEAKLAGTEAMRKLKYADEKSMQEHLEQLIDNNYESYSG